MMRVGVLGASFNPPTLGHKDVILQALNDFDRIFLVPSLRHPFNKKLINIHLRTDMVRIFLEANFSRLNGHRLELFNIEPALLFRNPKSQHVYTYDVLQQVEAYFKILKRNVKIQFIMGPDNAEPHVWQKFYRYQDIEKRWPPYIVKQNLKVRSQIVRDLLIKRKSDPESLKLLDQYLNQSVLRYINRYDLYLEK